MQVTSIPCNEKTVYIQKTVEVNSQLPVFTSGSIGGRKKLRVGNEKKKSPCFPDIWP
jgi:hypothetical protein